MQWPQPRFDRFIDTLLLRKAYRRPPLFDFHIAIQHKERLLGRKIESPADEIEFFARAGYDFVQCTVHVFSRELIEIAQHEKERGVSMGSNLNLINSLDEFRAKRWSWQDAAEGDLSELKPKYEWLAELASRIPAGMKILLHGADVFTYAWQLIDFEQFCIKSVEEPQLISAVMQSLCDAQMNALREAVRIAGDAIGCIFYSDDIAYTEGLMLSPAFFREHLVPVWRQLAQLGRSIGAPLVYHSDGRLYDLLDDLHAAGVRGIQPLEPKSMDPLQIKRRWPGKFCLMGNIDLDLMSRGSLEDVDREVREKLARLNEGGGYMPGVSNTVPYYVKFENWRRMVQIVRAMPEGELVPTMESGTLM